jgi:hypothetical protein
VLRERFGPKVEMRVVPPSRQSLVARLFNRQPIPESLLDPGALLAAVEERAAWARLGL